MQKLSVFSSSFELQFASVLLSSDWHHILKRKPLLSVCLQQVICSDLLFFLSNVNITTPGLCPRCFEKPRFACAALCSLYFFIIFPIVFAIICLSCSFLEFLFSFLMSSIIHSCNNNLLLMVLTSGWSIWVFQWWCGYLENLKDISLCSLLFHWGLTSCIHFINRKYFSLKNSVAARLALQASGTHSSGAQASLSSVASGEFKKAPDCLINSAHLRDNQRHLGGEEFPRLYRPSNTTSLGCLSSCS